MSAPIKVSIPLNRVEGDLEVTVEISNGRVSQAWCSGAMYRGFEQMMIGRGPLDGLVITPRVCGICTTGHLTAAALALDMIAGVNPPPDAIRLRNLALAAEHLQSDVRHSALMFGADLVNQAYRSAPLYDQAAARYQPFKGKSVLAAVQETKKILEIIAIIGGQWPHSSYMVPGGLASIPGRADLIQCRFILSKFRRWYEQSVLGCSIDQWTDLTEVRRLENWLEDQAHAESEVGFLIRYGRSIGLDRMGAGPGTYLSYGSLPLPPDSAVRHGDGRSGLIAAGWADENGVFPFDQGSIIEQTGHSWFKDQPGGLHPYEGRTEPYASGGEGRKYSWAKAPRYDGRSAEVGPLAEAVIEGDNLITALLAGGGSSALVRQLARLTRPARLIPAMEAWLEEVADNGGYYQASEPIEQGRGCGLTAASRGALGHWVRIKDGRIAGYQIITPTAWNASPRDDDGAPGPMEQALVGTPVPDPSNPAAIGQVIRSFDPCLVCSVHALDRSGNGRTRLGR